MDGTGCRRRNWSPCGSKQGHWATAQASWHLWGAPWRHDRSPWELGERGTGWGMCSSLPEGRVGALHLA